MRTQISERWPTVLQASVLAVAFATHAHAEQISFFGLVSDTDFVTAGTGGLRGIGTGTITVAGVAGTADLSYLYWHGPTRSTSINANATVAVNGIDVNGVNIGFSNDNRWGFLNSHAYRAESTAVIDGNGAYALSNFVKPAADANGAATVVFFQDGDGSNDRDVYIFDGNDSNFPSEFDAAGWAIELDGIAYSTGVARLTLFVADGQAFGPAGDGTLRVNGTAIASGEVFRGDTLPGGTGPRGDGNLFDIATYDITALLAPGLNNLTLALDAGLEDAFSLVAALVDVSAGDAPPNGVPEPAALALLGWILACIGWAQQRRRGMT